VEALNAVNAEVKGMVAIFTYGFNIAEENFAEANVRLNTLSNYDNLLEQAKDSNYITSKEAETLAEWREDPSQWSR
jgi:orotate phosphoribosyltransferase